MHMENLNYETWLRHGDQYLGASSSNKSDKKFNPTIRYNILSMALESFVMAILDFHQSLPDNHTYTDLIFALEQVAPIPQALKAKILKYENIQSICSMDKFYYKSPTEEELIELREAINEISTLAHEVCEYSKLG